MISIVPDTMRAVVITTPGGPEVLAVETRPVPDVGMHEVLVRVHATALNRADLLQRQGHYPAPAGAPADVPGLEFAGEVVRLGDRVTSCRRGDRVFGIVAGGAYAEYLAVDAETVVRMPDRLSFTDGAAVPEAFITAHDALVTQGELRAGERVMIHAVGSGVGLAAVQLVRAFGAVPYGTARTADKIDRARAFGLEDGVTVADDLHALPDALERLTRGAGIDLTLDLVGGPYVDASIRTAAHRGRIILIGTVAGRTATIPLGIVLHKRLLLRGTVLRARSIEEKREVSLAFARDVVPLLAAGTVRPAIDRIYDLAEVGAAHERMESNATFGKIVLRVT